MYIYAPQVKYCADFHKIHGRSVNVVDIPCTEFYTNYTKNLENRAKFLVRTRVNYAFQCSDFPANVRITQRH